MPYQWEPLLLDLPQEVKETGTDKQMAARETECEKYNLPITLFIWTESPSVSEGSGDIA